MAKAIELGRYPRPRVVFCLIKAKNPWMSQGKDLVQDQMI